MEIFELAAQLGKELKKDERLVRMANAKEAYENDMDLRTLMREYQVQQIALEKTAGQKDVEARFLGDDPEPHQRAVRSDRGTPRLRGAGAGAECGQRSDERGQQHHHV